MVEQRSLSVDDDLSVLVGDVSKSLRIALWLATRDFVRSDRRMFPACLLMLLLLGV